MLGRRFTSSRIRKEHRKRVLIQIGLWLLLAISILFLAVELFNLKQLRIERVRFEGRSGVSQKEMEAVVAPYLQGSYGHLFSKRNILFAPRAPIRDALLATFVRLEDVRVSRDGMHALRIATTGREPRALWCAEGKESGSCYYVDENGFTFAQAPSLIGGTFVRYARTAHGENGANLHPELGSYLASPEEFHAIEDFLGALAPFQLYVERVTWRSDALDLAVRSGRDKGTIVRFIIKIPLSPPYAVALSNLQSILGASKGEETIFSLDGVDYIDLRFENKVFYKKTSGAVRPAIIEDQR